MDRQLRVALRRQQLKPKLSAYVYWSIYVRTSNKRKLLESHLPPINEALESPELRWQILLEPENPGEYRLINFQNLEGTNVGALITPALRRAYNLADGWKLTGLGDLSAGRLRHVQGYWSLQGAIGSSRPALTTVMFEIEPGRVLGATEDGDGFMIDRPQLSADETAFLRKNTHAIIPPV